MPVVFNTDLYKYVEEEDRNKMMRWGGAIYLPRGYALNSMMSPMKEYDVITEDDMGGSFLTGLTSAANWVGANASTIGNVAGAVGKVAELGISIHKGVEEINTIKELRKKAMQADADTVANALANAPADKKSEVKTEEKKNWSSMFKFGSGNILCDDYTKKSNTELFNKIRAARKKESIVGDGFKIIQ